MTVNALPSSEPTRGMKVLSCVVALFIFGSVAIVLLMAFAKRNQTAAQVGACEALVNSLSQALKAYELDKGQYPEAGLPELEKPSDRRRPYFEYRSNQKDPLGRILDPWGRPFIYRTRQGSYPFIHSFGPNGIDEGGKGDDITNDD